VNPCYGERKRDIGANLIAAPPEMENKALVLGEYRSGMRTVNAAPALWYYGEGAGSAVPDALEQAS
jgi:hypothetical protein